MGAGKRATLIAEQFGLEQLFGQRRTIDRDKRSAAARRGPVNEPGDDLFTGARLAVQEDRRLRGGHLRRPRQHLAPGGGVSDRLTFAACAIQHVRHRLRTLIHVRGTSARGHTVAVGLPEPVVRHHDRKAGADSTRRLDVLDGVSLRQLGQEPEPDDPLTRWTPNPEERSVAGRHEQCERPIRRESRTTRLGAAEIVDDAVVVIAGGRDRAVDRAVLRRSHLKQHAACLIMNNQLEAVVRNHDVRGTRDLCKAATNVQRLREHPQ